MLQGKSFSAWTMVVASKAHGFPAPLSATSIPTDSWFQYHTVVEVLSLHRLRPSPSRESRHQLFKYADKVEAFRGHRWWDTPLSIQGMKGFVSISWIRKTCSFPRSSSGSIARYGRMVFQMLNFLFCAKKKKDTHTIIFVQITAYDK